MPKTQQLYTETLSLRVTPETAELIEERVPHLSPKTKKGPWLREIVTQAAEALPKPRRKKGSAA